MAAARTGGLTAERHAERFLVTGALGCIGAWTVERLSSEGMPVWTYDLGGDPHRLRLVLDEEALSRIHFIAGDIADLAAFERAVAENGITHIVHLAALQVPFVKADPVQGARVNVVGATVVLEAAKRRAEQVKGLCYASSIGVYGGAELYPPGPLAHDAPHLPPHLYGVHKQANEGTARIYWIEHGVHSVGLRPYVVYGPGRDQGWTSSPTKAMLAAALGRPYRIGFGGTVVYQHARDVASVMIRAARARLPGAPVYNLGGSAASMEEVVRAIETAAPESAGKITFSPSPLPHPPAVDDRKLNEDLGPIRWLPLAEGVRQTVDCFRQAIKAGWLDVPRALN